MKIQKNVHWRTGMELDIRLQILKDADQICEETFEALKRVIEMFKNRWRIELTEDNGAMLITHLSVALERIKRGEEIKGIDSEIYNQIESHYEFEKCRQVLKDITYEAGINIPKSEETFIMMHLCTLFESNNKINKGEY
jgi:transcriptional antiterminator